MGAAEGLERTLIAIVARCLRVPLREIDPSAPLSRYGLDSLSALELTEAVAAETGLELSEAAFYDAPSVQSLALQLLLRSPLAVDPAEDRRVRAMRADAVLDAAIRPCGLPATMPGRFLLTGANGFLGVHLLRALLDGGAAEVLCLVRADGDEAAALRLDAALRRYRIAPIDPRVRVIAADIVLPRFGLTAAAYGGLARQAGAIVHCAAQVNWGAAYEQLRPVNVEATRAILRFACTGVAKPVHFVSSVAAGYSSRDAAPLDEYAAAADPAGLHLGYAQTKWVAERLVEAVRNRGLPAAIYRPTLIAGHSDCGIGNDDDLFARMLRGCAALGYAPDLDWPLDACPVDFVAQAVARAALREATRSRVMHLRNPRPARWTEAVLWMNLRGHRVRLEPYAAWVERVRREAHDGHPLQALRGFLLHKPDRAGGHHLAELYARPQVRELRATASDGDIAALGVHCPRLGARLLERYFDRWTQAGLIGRPDRTIAPGGRHPAGTDPDRTVEAVLRRHFDEPGLRVAASRGDAFGSEHSLIGELGTWRAGLDHAMQRRRMVVQRADGSQSRVDVVLKQKLPDALVLDVAQDVAVLCDPGLGRAFGAYREQSEFVGARARECAAYAAGRGPMSAYMPQCFGVADREPPMLVLECVRQTVLANAMDGPAQWSDAAIEAVLTGIAAVHGQWLANEQALTSLKLLRSPDGDDEAQAWWSALGDYAGRWLQPWLGTRWGEAQARTIARLPGLRCWQSGQPHSLIHGDLNPRNLVLRRTAQGGKLCAFDWELAAWGLPQRDVVEFLAFVLAADFAPESVRRWIEVSRQALERHAGCALDAAAWRAGVRVALADFGVTRLPMYFLAHRFRPQAYLERVARCWWRLTCVLGTEP